jgi:hypothetical protein
MSSFKRKPEQWQSLLGTSAFDPLEIFDLQDAIREGKKVADVQGRKFQLKYRNGSVFYAPLDDRIFVPSGWLEIGRFLRG